MLGTFATTSRLTPIHHVSPLYCRMPPAHRCLQRQRRRRRRQRQRVTERTAMAPRNGPNNPESPGEERSSSTFWDNWGIPNWQCERSTVTRTHADPAANCLDYCRVTRLSPTVADSVHTARPDSTRPSSCVGRCPLAVSCATVHLGLQYVCM